MKLNVMNVNLLFHDPGVSSPEQGEHLVLLLHTVLLLSHPVDAVPLDQVPVSSAHAHQALVVLCWHEAGETLNLSWEWSEDGDWSQTAGLRHHQTPPARAHIDQVLHHTQRAHLALPRAELVVNVDGDQRLAAGDQFAAVQLVDHALGLHLPLVDDTAGVEVGEDVLVVFGADHLHHLMGVQERVSHDVLARDHTLSQTEHCHLTLGLSTPDLNLTNIIL